MKNNDKDGSATADADQFQGSDSAPGNVNKGVESPEATANPTTEPVQPIVWNLDDAGVGSPGGNEAIERSSSSRMATPPNYEENESDPEPETGGGNTAEATKATDASKPEASDAAKPAAEPTPDNAPVDAAEGLPPELSEAQRQDSGLACLVMLLQFHEIAVDAKQLAHEYAPGGEAISELNMLRAAKAQNMKARATQLTGKGKKAPVQRLAKLPLPAIAKRRGEDGVASGWFIIAKVSDEKALVQLPESGIAELTLDELDTIWTGRLIQMVRRAKSVMEEVGFGFRWFIPVIFKYKHLFFDVLAASLFLQLFGLITPLFFQVVIDKVLVHRGLTTLDVLVVGLIIITSFEVVLGFLRTYLMSHTTSRIDVTLGTKLFDHLVRLPVSYFESRPTGQTVARVRELENVRSFITGNALTVLLDLAFTFVFFAVMYHFSPTLTYIVLASIPVYALLSLAITPALRNRIEENFQRGAINQAFLVESVSGVETLKAMAVEPQMKARWEENLAAYVRSSFRTVTLGAFGSQAVMLINKIVTALLLWFGAKLVIGGELTVGQLVAFNMLAGQVNQPIIRIAQLWQDFQQFRISISKLGDILNTKTEVAGQSMPSNLPELKGGIELENVTFRYAPGQPEILRDINLGIQPGETIGFVGRSGSGKSTITKLVQRLHTPESGRVLIDGIEVSMMDPAWLRRQVGVVLQENVLFNRSVRENIALSEPAASMERVVNAAELAGAHEFILQLPGGYDTILEERGSNLSGGQRQRIAIARALLTDPRILILDEATSALDYESEQHFQKNMARIAEDRTVIVVAHRLSTVMDADRIVVMERGEIIENDAPQKLLKNPDGAFTRLFLQSVQRPRAKKKPPLAPNQAETKTGVRLTDLSAGRGAPKPTAAPPVYGPVQPPKKAEDS